MQMKKPNSYSNSPFCNKFNTVKIWLLYYTFHREFQYFKNYVLHYFNPNIIL